MKERIDITIEKEIIIKFRKMFVIKKGDLSKSIQDLMIKAMKGGNEK